MFQEYFILQWWSRSLQRWHDLKFKKNMSGDFHMFVFGTRLSNAALKTAIEHIYSHLSSSID